MATRSITPVEKAYAAELLQRARIAQKEVESYDQARVEYLYQALAWATYKEETFKHIAVMDFEKSGLGDPVGRARITLER